MTTNTDKLAAQICRDVAELPDRNSPEDWPEAMLVTHDELQAIVTEAIEAAGRVQQAEPVAWMNPKTREVISPELRQKWLAMGWGGEKSAEAYPLPLYLAAPTAQEASKPVQAEAPSDWRETIQGAIDELPYQHYLIPRLTQLLSVQKGRQ